MKFIRVKLTTDPSCQWRLGLCLSLCLLTAVASVFAQEPLAPISPVQQASDGGVPITTQLTDGPSPAVSSDVEEPVVTTLDAVLDAGDLIDVQVFDTPELSGKLRVNGSGAITLPVGGGVVVRGRTADQARVAIEQRFREQNVLRNPHVEVYLIESASQNVTVGGEVRSPGVYPLHGRRTVLDFVSLAGGVNSQASDTVTLLHEHLPAETVNLGLQRSASPPSQIAVQPGDKIVVERSGIVYVVGDVGRPGDIWLRITRPSRCCKRWPWPRE